MATNATEATERHGQFVASCDLKPQSMTAQKAIKVAGASLRNLAMAAQTADATYQM